MCQKCLGEKIISKCCGGPLSSNKCLICGRFASKVECKNCNTSTLSKLPNYSFLLYNYFKDIEFNDKDHSYWYKGERLTSATTRKAEVKNEFQKEYWLKFKTLQATDGVKVIPIKNKDNSYTHMLVNGLKKHYKNINVDTSELEKEWEKKREDGLRRGTAIHNYLENAWKRKYYTRRSELLDGFIADHDFLIPISLEQIVSDFKSHAGQVDGLFYDTVTDQIILLDYKGLALDTPIATPLGYKLMSEIQVGDEVYDGEGNVTKVKHVSEIHNNPCYKITFTTNEELIADHEHKWNIKIGNNNEETTVTTEYMFQHIIKNDNKNKIKIKNHVNLETSYTKLSIDPYVLGVWLADGNSHDGKITCVNDEIWEEIEKRGYRTSVNLEKNIDKAEYRTVYKLRSKLRELGLLQNKHIPDIYLRSSFTQRLDLLRGFMDGDGYYNKVRNRFVMVTTKEWQALDIQKLVSTFGISCTILPAKTSGFGKSDIDCFHVTFSSDIFPFLCRNQSYDKKELLSKKRKNYRSTHRYIKNVEKIDTVPTKCISVESDTSTYLAGHGLIKTHNTDRELKLKSKYNIKMKYPFEDLDDCNFNGYVIQMNMYRYMLEPIIPIHKMQIVHFTDTSYDKFDIPFVNVSKLMNNDYKRRAVNSKELN